MRKRIVDNIHHGKGIFDMKKHLLITCILVFAASTVMAETQSPQALALAEKGVVGTNASGESQTTVIDENGNLKMVPADSKTLVPKTQPGQGPPGRILPQDQGKGGQGGTQANAPLINPPPSNVLNASPAPGSVNLPQPATASEPKPSTIGGVTLQPPGAATFQPPGPATNVQNSGAVVTVPPASNAGSTTTQQQNTSH